MKMYSVWVKQWRANLRQWLSASQNILWKLVNASCAWGVLWSLTNITSWKQTEGLGNGLQNLSFQSILFVEEKEHFVRCRVQVLCAHPTHASLFSWELLYLEQLKSIKDFMAFDKYVIYVRGIKSKNKALQDLREVFRLKETFIENNAALMGRDPFLIGLACLVAQLHWNWKYLWKRVFFFVVVDITVALNSSRSHPASCRQRKSCHGVELIWTHQPRCFSNPLLPSVYLKISIYKTAVAQFVCAWVKGRCTCNGFPSHPRKHENTVCPQSHRRFQSL